MRRLWLICWLAAAAVSLPAELHSQNRNDWYDTPLAISGDTTLIGLIAEGATEATVHVRLRTSPRQQCVWGVSYGAPRGESQQVSVTVPKLQPYDDIVLPPCTVAASATGESVSCDALDAAGGYNSLKLVFAPGTLHVYGGSDTQQLLLSLPCAQMPTDVALWSSQRAECQRIQVESVPGARTAASRFVSEESLAAHLAASRDQLEGYWEYLDRNADPGKATLGGRYRLAIARNAGHYDIIYLSGAETRGADWCPLMLKGRLSPTAFEGNYDMEWIDAGHRAIGGDTNAQLSADGAILTLRFPELRTELRLARAAQKD